MTDIEALKSIHKKIKQQGKGNSIEVKPEHPWVQRMIAAGYAKLNKTFVGPTKEYYGDCHFELTELGLEQIGELKQRN